MISFPISIPSFEVSGRNGGYTTLVGCSETAGTGGSGGMGGTGGMAGSGGSAGSGGTGGIPECQNPEDCNDANDCTVDICDPSDGACDYAPAEDGTLCSGGVGGICIAGSCAVFYCGDSEDGTVCLLNPSVNAETGVCVGDTCEAPCDIDADCTDYKDCTTETCMASGLCTDPVTVKNGTSCAGGTCRLTYKGAECVLQGTVLPCTEQAIRNAIAAGGGPYTFDCDGPTTVVTAAELVIDNDVVLDGEGNLIVDGNEDHRVFSVSKGVVAELHNLSIQHGNALDGRGAGVLNDGTLTLTSSIVSGNTSRSFAGGIGNYGTLTLTNSIVRGNSGHGCGGICSSGIATVLNSVISENTSEGGGGGIVNYQTLTLTNSTVSGNTGDYGGGIQNNNFVGTLTVTNSTVSGNTAGLSGGSGGSISNNSGTVTLTNSLIDDDCYNVVGTITSGGGNLESPGDTCGFGQPTDQVNVTEGQLNLGPLQDNGGPTMTHALGAGSVAIDVIPEAACVDADGEPLTTDQRGEPRPAGTTDPKMCDVGAVEVQP